jgi:hypothetical protein
MPHFYFHVCDGTGFVEDEEGRELRDEASARAEALRGARSIMADDLQRGQLDLSSFIEVEDGEHALLFTLMFSEAVELKTGDGSRARRPHQ